MERNTETTPTNPSTPCEYWREAQAAEHLGVSVKLLQKWRQEGSGPVYVKFGRAVRYPHKELNSFARDRRVEPVA